MPCSAWLCRENNGLEYLLYLGAETKPKPLTQSGRQLTQSGRQTWKWGNGFENVVIFTPKEWAKISPIELEPGEGPIPVAGGFFALPNVKEHAPPPAGARSETGVEVQTTPDYDTAKLPNLAIVFEQTKSGPLHGPETPARAVIIISGTSIRDVTLGDIMDQLRAVANPLGDPADGGTKKEESNLGRKVQPIGRAGVSEDHIHSLANVPVLARKPAPSDSDP